MGNLKGLEEFSSAITGADCEATKLDIFRLIWGFCCRLWACLLLLLLLPCCVEEFLLELSKASHNSRVEAVGEFVGEPPGAFKLSMCLFLAAGVRNSPLSKEAGAEEEICISSSKDVGQSYDEETWLMAKGGLDIFV